MSNIHKIWGRRYRVHLDEKSEVDLLYINKNCFCSTHSHKSKINKFMVVSGVVVIETEFGTTILKANDSWVVEPPMKHRFCGLEDSVMLEIAYVKESVIDPDDINRESLGGKIVAGVEYTINELKTQGMLDL